MKLPQLPSLPRISLTKILVVCLVVLQFPLWFGEGGWIRVWRLERQIDAKLAQTEGQRLEIAQLEAEVRDLKKNPKAAEERARFELGLIMPGERFVQWVLPNAESAKPAPPAGR